MDVRFAFPLSQWPWWLLGGCGIVGVLALGLHLLEGRRQARLYRFVEASLAPRLLVDYDAAVRRPLFWLPVIGLAMLALSLAQPHWGSSWVEVTRGGRDILVLLDTSESMNAEDPSPSRLERARQKIESMLELCPADRFGLVAFSGDAVLQCPFTLDHAYFRAVLRALSTDSVSLEGTNIAAALHEAAKVFEEDVRGDGEDGRHARAILLLSDGEQGIGDAVRAAGRLGRYAGLYVIGIGSPQGAVVTFPDWLGEYGRPVEAGTEHLSPLDEESLIAVAEAGQGVYVRTTPHNADVNHLHQEWETLSARAVSGELRFRLVNRYRWPLCAAALCFAGEGLWLVLMPITRRRRMRRNARLEREARYA